MADEFKVSITVNKDLIKYECVGCGGIRNLPQRTAFWSELDQDWYRRHFEHKAVQLNLPMEEQQ